MQSIVKTAAWAFFALLAYFLFAGIVSPWLDLPSPGNSGFVPVFTLFSLLHGCVALGGRRVALFFGLTVVISYLVEEAGVRTGLLFGRYHYSDDLGIKLGNVPILIPLGWFMMIYPSWVVAQAVLRGRNLRGPAGMVALALLSALTMTGWDMVMDPPMIRGGAWVWHDGGPYFGVPLQNYVGWVLNTFVIYLVFDIADRALSRRESAPYRFGSLFAALPVVIYTLFALDYVSPHRAVPLTLIAVFTMLVPALFALAQLALPPAAKAQQ
ncbi:carotenoid biosynthesis protein [Sphingomonas sp. dw_22]|uniref:carotenoid biosynthesis protein n=1 Tax=Sphingomonas sp. dw_22 TaxID=2721175 RepID=UPI001BD57074|nr:carotenoid biosynthesis protein [Sphingomonas sp. dw_22]